MRLVCRLVSCLRHSVLQTSRPCGVRRKFEDTVEILQCSQTPIRNYCISLYFRGTIFGGFWSRSAKTSKIKHLENRALHGIKLCCSWSLFGIMPYYGANGYVHISFVVLLHFSLLSGLCVMAKGSRFSLKVHGLAVESRTLPKQAYSL